MTSKNKRAVVVTTAHRGVFFGYMGGAEKNKKLRLESARNCLYWSKEIGGFMGLAANGPNENCRIGPSCTITLNDVTAVLECTEKAEEAWLKADWRF